MDLGHSALHLSVTRARGRAVRGEQPIKTALVMALVSCVIVRFTQLDVVVRKNENVSTVLCR